MQLLSLTAMATTSLTSDAEVVNAPLMIAHAGGGYAGQNYTNSIEALDSNHAAGFRYFEIDFSWTHDGQMVCLHDWDKTFKKLFGYKPKQPIDLTDFKQLVDGHDGFQVCTLDTLADWLRDKPDVKIITDIKYHNLQGLQNITLQFPELIKQFIPQIYQPEEYSVIKGLGYEELIWILYQYKGSKKSVLEQAANMDLLAISMRASQAKNRTLKKLLALHRIFVYTINKDRIKNKLINQYGVTGIYTDFLPFE